MELKWWFNLHAYVCALIYFYDSYGQNVSIETGAGQIENQKY